MNDLLEKVKAAGGIFECETVTQRTETALKNDNVFRHILEYGNDEDFVPAPAKEPTDHAAGTFARIEVLRKRLEAGEHIWHPDDRRDYSGIDAKNEKLGASTSQLGRTREGKVIPRTVKSRGGLPIE